VDIPPDLMVLLVLAGTRIVRLFEIRRHRPRLPHDD
jgi:hypothetical protein